MREKSDAQTDASDKDCDLCDVLDLNGNLEIKLKTTGEIIDNE